jgi:hypothetical protein
MRLIDADKLKTELDAWARSICKSDVYCREDALYIIDSMPTIDAAPVVRGRWVVDECDTTDDVPSSSWIDFHCSECNTDYGLEEGQYGWCRYEKIPFQYCPNCGAKMDKED